MAESSSTSQAQPGHVLIYAPRGRNAPLTKQLLDGADVPSVICNDLDDLCTRIGDDALALLIADDALTLPSVERLRGELGKQPPWSDLPVLVFRRRTPDALDGGPIAELANVTFLDQPVQVATMLAGVRAALRGRQRQYAARRAIESRDQFLAMLGHELRNPLGTIRLAIELLGRSPDPDVLERQRAVLDRQSRHLVRLVDDLLDVARITSGKIILATEAVELVDLVRRCCDAMQVSADLQQLHLGFETSVRRLLVSGDATRLEQVVTNLVTNAIKYTPAGGTVRVTVGRTDGMARISVADTGIGIDPALLERVFDLFEQAETSLARSQGGLGLGLTVVQNLVRLHRGVVEAFSDGPGCGSEFVVMLPLLTGIERPATPDAPTVAMSARTVVVVEDNVDLRTSLECLLSAARHRVSTASDGPHGLDLILEQRPEVACVDIGLPGFDGFELARRVRNSSVGGAVRLIAITGYGQPEDRARALESGFDAFLTKPVELTTLLSTIDTVARRA